MSRIEELLSTAYQEAADVVRPDNVRPAVTVPARGHKRRRPALTAFTPVAAAVAVIVVIAAGLVVPRLLAGPSQPAARDTAAPPFLLLALNPANPRSAPKLEVVAAATGRVVSTLDTLGRGTWAQVAATGNDRRFVVARVPVADQAGSIALYTLTLSAHGDITRLSRFLAFTTRGRLESIAVSADGSTVAYSTVTGCFMGGPCHSTVGVIANGRTRQWTQSGTMAPTDLSLSRDGGTLTFMNIWSGGLAFPADQSVWLLSTRSAPGGLTGASRKLVSVTAAEPGQQWVTWLRSALISPDGRTVYVLTERLWPITSSPSTPPTPGASGASGGPTPPSPFGEVSLTPYDTVGGGSPGTPAGWKGTSGLPGYIIAAGDDICAFSFPLSASASGVQTAYLIDPPTLVIRPVTLPDIGGEDSIAW
jgi:hypothetical protein